MYKFIQSKLREIKKRHCKYFEKQSYKMLYEMIKKHGNEAI